MKYEKLIEVLKTHAAMQIPVFLDIEDFTDNLDIAHDLGIDTGKCLLARDLLSMLDS